MARRVNQTTVQLRNKGKFGPVVPISELGDKNVIVPISNLTVPVRERKSKKGDKKPVRRRKKKVVEVDQIQEEDQEPEDVEEEEEQEELDEDNIYSDSKDEAVEESGEAEQSEMSGFK